MYMPYTGDTRYMQEITTKSGETLVQIVTRFFTDLKLKRLPSVGIQSIARKMNWNAS